MALAGQAYLKQICVSHIETLLKQRTHYIDNYLLSCFKFSLKRYLKQIETW